MTQEDARRVIQSHKFVENHFIYGMAKRQANRAMTEVDTNIKNHTFMNSYIERKYGNKNNMSACGDGGGMVGKQPQQQPKQQYSSSQQQHQRNAYHQTYQNHFHHTGCSGERKYGVVNAG